jgi:hypothetical protein
MSSFIFSDTITGLSDSISAITVGTCFAYAALSVLFISSRNVIMTTFLPSGSGWSLTAMSFHALK